MYTQLEALTLGPQSPPAPFGVGSPLSSGIHIPSLDSAGSATPVSRSPAPTPFLDKIRAPSSPSLVAKREPASPYSQRVILTTYPGQVGIHPIPLKWGAATAEERGPVVVSRYPSTIKLRNAIGAHSGSYSVYKALAAAQNLMDPNHKPGEP